MVHLKSIISIFCITLILQLTHTYPSQGQSINYVLEKLAKQGNIIRSREPDSVRLNVAITFHKSLDSLLKNNKTSMLPLETITNLSVLYNTDSTLQLISWIFPFNKGGLNYFGYLHYFNNKKDIWEIKELKSMNQSMSIEGDKLFSTENWYGALYYSMIKTDSLYTLIGWNGANNAFDQKIIDILYFDNAGEARFGKEIFEGYEEPFNYSENYIPKRVVLKYAKDGAITLNKKELLDADIPSFMRNNPKIKHPISTDVPVIFFNKIEPIQPAFEGNFRYYYPMTETIQGFVYYQGKWKFVENLYLFYNN